MTSKISTITVGDSSIRVIARDNTDYICLTDMVKNYGGDQAIYGWLRNRNTIEFLGVWELIHNPEFKGGEFETFKKQVGLNSFHMTPKKWIQATNAIGITSRPGRYGGGTFANKDIAFEFGSWLSAEFKLYMIKEFQRLKERESELEQWDYRRFLTRVNYRLQTSAVQQTLVPLSMLPMGQHGIVYAKEADVINLALFGMTASDWRKQNPKVAKSSNIRDYASIEQLTVLANLESINSMMITEKVPKEQRFERLQKEAARQLVALVGNRKMNYIE